MSWLLEFTADLRSLIFESSAIIWFADAAAQGFVNK
jgi:hypothetical protein